MLPPGEDDARWDNPTPSAGRELEPEASAEVWSRTHSDLTTEEPGSRPA